MRQATRRMARGAGSPVDPEHQPGSGSVTWAANVLRYHEMPPDEIQAVLTSDDPELIHRYLELHRERLEEWVGDQRRTLAAVERLLAEVAAERRRARDEDARNGDRAVRMRRP